MLLIKESIRSHGNDPRKLSPKSSRRVVVRCEHCGRPRDIRFRDSFNRPDHACNPCANSLARRKKIRYVESAHAATIIPRNPEAPCRFPGCKTLTRRSNGYCQACEDKLNAARLRIRARDGARDMILEIMREEK